jgi:hypothetical protein
MATVAGRGTKMLKWFDAGPAETQADQAVAEVERLVPKEDLAPPGLARKKQVGKLGPTIDRHRHQASMAGYNIYQKAKFANRVKWRLRDSGFPDDFIDSVVRLLII